VCPLRYLGPISSCVSDKIFDNRISRWRSPCSLLSSSLSNRSPSQRRRRAHEEERGLALRHVRVQMQIDQIAGCSISREPEGVGTANLTGGVGTTKGRHEQGVVLPCKACSTHMTQTPTSPTRDTFFIAIASFIFFRYGFTICGREEAPSTTRGHDEFWRDAVPTVATCVPEKW
jgi:hypothetical protein